MEGLSAHGPAVGAGCGSLQNQNMTGRRVREIYGASGGAAACGTHNTNTMHTFLWEPHAQLLLLTHWERDYWHHRTLNFLFIHCRTTELWLSYASSPKRAGPSHESQHVFAHLSAPLTDRRRTYNVLVLSSEDHIQVFVQFGQFVLRAAGEAYLGSSCRRCWRSASRRCPERICCRVWSGAPSSGPAASPCSSGVSWRWRTSWTPEGDKGGRGHTRQTGRRVNVKSPHSSTFTARLNVSSSVETSPRCRDRVQLQISCSSLNGAERNIPDVLQENWSLSAFYCVQRIGWWPVNASFHDLMLWLRHTSPSCLFWTRPDSLQ